MPKGFPENRLNKLPKILKPPPNKPFTDSKRLPKIPSLPNKLPTESLILVKKLLPAIPPEDSSIPLAICSPVSTLSFLPKSNIPEKNFERPPS